MTIVYATSCLIYIYYRLILQVYMLSTAGSEYLYVGWLIFAPLQMDMMYGVRHILKLAQCNYIWCLSERTSDKKTKKELVNLL